MERFQVNPSLGDVSHQSDAWHAHGAGEPQPQAAHGEVSPLAIGVVSAVSVVFFVLSLLALIWWFEHVRQRELARKTEVDTGASYVGVHAADQRDLASVSWGEQPNTARVPITFAMEQVVREYQAASGGGR